MGPKGDHLGQDQPFGGGYADRVALRPFQRRGVGECPRVEGEDRLQPVDSNIAEWERGDMLPNELFDDGDGVERETPFYQIVQQYG